VTQYQRAYSEWPLANFMRSVSFYQKNYQAAASAFREALRPFRSRQVDEEVGATLLERFLTCLGLRERAVNE